MKITFKDLIDKNTWLHSCILSALTSEVIESGRDKKEYEVKLLVNGFELEPTVLSELIDNVLSYIDSEAEKKYISEYKDKMYDAKKKADKMQDIIDKAFLKISKEFNILADDED